MSKPDRPVPMYVWPAAVVGLLTALALGLNHCSSMMSVPVAKTDLPAFQLVGPGDVETLEVSRHALGDGDIRTADGLVGHVTLSAVTHGEVVAKADVTSAKPAAYVDLVPVTVHADTGTAGSPGSGDAVRLLFAPAPDAGDVTPLELDAVLLKTSDAKAGGKDYVVAVTSENRTRLLEVLGRSRLVLVAA